jgi:hypothetical protein
MGNFGSIFVMPVVREEEKTEQRLADRRLYGKRLGGEE